MKDVTYKPYKFLIVILNLLVKLPVFIRWSILSTSNELRLICLSVGTLSRDQEIFSKKITLSSLVIPLSQNGFEKIARSISQLGVRQLDGTELLCRGY